MRIHCYIRTFKVSQKNVLKYIQGGALVVLLNRFEFASSTSIESISNRSLQGEKLDQILQTREETFKLHHRKVLGFLGSKGGRKGLEERRSQ